MEVNVYKNLTCFNRWSVSCILCNSTSWKFDNYTPPKGQKIDYNAQALDRVRNNLTNEQVMNNTINGKYNVKR